MQTTLDRMPEPSVVNISLQGLTPSILLKRVVRTTEGSLGFDRHSITFDIVGETEDGGLLYISMTKIRHRHGVSCTVIVSRIDGADEPLEYRQDSTLAELLEDIVHYPNPYSEVHGGR